MRLLRWIVCLPAGALASLVCGGLAGAFVDRFGDGGWVSSLVSGAVCGGIFFLVTFSVAPERTTVLKWVTVVVVGSIGFLSALGPFLSEGDPLPSITGGAMLAIAVWYGRKPVREIEAEMERG